MDYSELRSKIKINRFALDEELMNQSSLYQDVAEEHARSVSARDRSYEEIKVVDAELDQVIREEKIAAGEKFTEAAIQSEIRQHGDHKDAFKDYLDKKQKSDELEALREAYRQRAYMLRELVSLYTAGYYSDPHLKGQTGQKVEETIDKNVREKQQEKRRERRRLGSRV